VITYFHIGLTTHKVLENDQGFSMLFWAINRFFSSARQQFSLCKSQSTQAQSNFRDAAQKTV
jgi:hypothetical protein